MRRLQAQGEESMSKLKMIQVGTGGWG
ncbi:uncharacterized protein METZ01_LOCUS346270, partial [marine metagenome]